MSNIDKRADSVTRIIADLKLKHGSGDTYAPIMRWDELLALLDELEVKDKRIVELTEIFRSGRKFISEYAGLGDVSAAEFIKIIDRAVANKEIN